MKVIPYALLTLGAIFGFVVSWSLNQFWKFTIGFMFDKLARIGIPTGFFGSIKPFAFLESVNNSVHDFLSGIAAASEHAMTSLFTQMITSLRGLASELGNLAEAVEQKIHGLIVAVLPGFVRNALGSVWAQVKRIGPALRKIEHLIGTVARLVGRAAAAAGNFALKTAKRLIKAVAHTATSAWHLALSLKKRIGKLERQLVGKRLAGLINKALLGLGLPWVFADNIIAIAKALVHWSVTLAKAVIRYFQKVDEPISLIGLTNVSAQVLTEMEKALRWYIKEYHADRIAPGSTIGDIEV